MLGLRCIAGEPAVLLGRTGDSAPQAGESVEVTVEAGDAPRLARATASPDGTVAFGPAESRVIITKAARAAVLSFRWKEPSGTEVLLVFRPALTRAATAPLAQACAIPP